MSRDQPSSADEQQQPTPLPLPSPSPPPPRSLDTLAAAAAPVSNSCNIDSSSGGVQNAEDNAAMAVAATANTAAAAVGPAAAAATVCGPGAEVLTERERELCAAIGLAPLSLVAAKEMLVRETTRLATVASGVADGSGGNAKGNGRKVAVEPVFKLEIPSRGGHGDDNKPPLVSDMFLTSVWREAKRGT